jgi:hypothetical protein
MKRLALIIGLALMLLPAAAVAQTIDFAEIGGPGAPGTFWWGGIPSGVSGNTFNIDPNIVEANNSGYPFVFLAGSDWSWYSGPSTAPTADQSAHGVLANFTNGWMTISQDGLGSYCSGDCFSGTLVSGTLKNVGGGFLLEDNFTSGTVDAKLLSVLGLPNPKGGYAGSFSVTLKTGKCTEVSTIDGNGQGSCGTWTSADLNMSPVPEPGTLTLLGTGLFGLAGVVRRKLKK